MDISKPLKANFSFVKLDQVKEFLRKIRSKSGHETQEENISASESLSKKDVSLTSQCYKSRISDSEDHVDGGQKASAQESLWRGILCCQKISIHATQMVVSVETCPNPSKPCLLASFSNISGTLNVKANSKMKGKSYLFIKDEIIVRCSEADCAAKDNTNLTS